MFSQQTKPKQDREWKPNENIFYPNVRSLLFLQDRFQILIHVSWNRNKKILVQWYWNWSYWINPNRPPTYRMKAKIHPSLKIIFQHSTGFQIGQSATGPVSVSCQDLWHVNKATCLFLIFTMTSFFMLSWVVNPFIWKVITSRWFTYHCPTWMSAV